MAALKQIEVELEGTKDLALVNKKDNSVWLVVPVRWWDLANLIWWFFIPADKKARSILTLRDGSKVKMRVVRVATRHAFIRGFD